MPVEHKQIKKGNRVNLYRFLIVYQNAEAEIFETTAYNMISAIITTLHQMERSGEVDSY